MPKLSQVSSYPIKSLAGVSLDKCELTRGAGIPGDRRLAISRGEDAGGNWMSCSELYVNAEVDGLLKLSLSQKRDGSLEIINPDGGTITVDGSDPVSVEDTNNELPRFLGSIADPAEGPPKLVRINTGCWDFPDTPISIINPATVAEIAKAMGTDLDPARFRGNLLVDGLAPWEEFSWMGRRMRIGDAEIEVERPIRRCPAPGVNPQTGERDIRFAEAMPEHFGHAYCGMYAKVVRSGSIAKGSTIEVAGESDLPLQVACSNSEDYRLWPRLVEITTCEKSETATRLSLKATTPWGLPDASPGQRLRISMGPDQWTTEYIAATSPGFYHLEVEKSATGDPLTEQVRSGYSKGDTLVIIGPFGSA